MMMGLYGLLEPMTKEIKMRMELGSCGYKNWISTSGNLKVREPLFGQELVVAAVWKGLICIKEMESIT